MEKFLREYRLVREPLAAQSAPRDAPDMPVCRYVIAVGADGDASSRPGCRRDVQGVYADRHLSGRLSPGALHRPGGRSTLGDNRRSRRWRPRSSGLMRAVS